MRTIKKRSAPAKLVKWRLNRIAKANATTHPFNYRAMRNEDGLSEAVEASLFNEQGQICAYTGRRLHLDLKPEFFAWFHIEHLKGQARCRAEAETGDCELGYDTHYVNMVACWPEPNRDQATPYGADVKGNWPETHEEDPLFVSPLKVGCTARFKFTRRGEIRAARSNDTAAIATIDKLGLNHEELNALRSSAIQGAFSPNKRPLTAEQLDKLRRVMDQEERELDNGKNIQLRAYCFAIRPNIDREILKLKGIAKSKKSKRTK